MDSEEAPHRVEASSREVQVVFSGFYIARTRSPLLVWEHATGTPRYYLPETSIVRENIGIQPLSGDSTKSVKNTTDLEVDTQQAFELTAGDKRTVFTAFRTGTLKDFVRFEFQDMDAWLESGTLIRLPPKNPSRRIDTVVISSHITITIGNTLIAEADQAIVLYETGLPGRYYLPATSVVDWRLLKQSKKVTACPSKGEARYFDLQLPGEDTLDSVVWYYLYPVAESAAIAGRFAFAVGTENLSFVVDGLEMQV